MHILFDDMKKESKFFLIPSIGFIVWAIVTPLHMTFDAFHQFEIKEIVLACLAYVVLAAFCIYLWLSAFLYKLEVTDTHVKVRTLFFTKTLPFQEIGGYTYKRYRKTAFYQFYLHTAKKTIIVSTRHHLVFAQILREKGIVDKTDSPSANNP